MEVAPGIHRIQAPLGDRFVCVYLLTGEDSYLLVDTGLDDTTQSYILPYMAKHGLDPARVHYILTSHADFDHSAGNRSAKEAFPQAKLMCHRLDKAMIEEMEKILDDRYDEFKASHGIYESAENRAAMLSQSRTCPVDLALSGGESVRLGSGLDVELWHTPGHSRGHMTVHVPSSGALIICDAALYFAVLRADGEPAFPPTYRYVDSYWTTLCHFEAVMPKMLLTSHYPVYAGEQVAEFLAESRRFVERTDAHLRTLLQGAEHPLTMLEIIEATSAALGNWPQATSPALSQPLEGHLERMVRHGLVRRTEADGESRATFDWIATG